MLDQMLGWGCLQQPNAFSEVHKQLGHISRSLATWVFPTCVVSVALVYCLGRV